MAFKIAGSLAFRKAAEQADPVCWNRRGVPSSPDEFIGDIMAT
jgi:hypothetical protein